MIKIGIFSKLGQVSIKALRLYDQMGLLKPIKVDNRNGYRHYSVTQLPRLNRILAFKELGFSLEQIGQMLDQQVSIDEIQGMFRLKQAELQRTVMAEQERLRRVEIRLHQIENEGNMTQYDVVIKKVELVKVASIRAKLPSYEAIGALYGELEAYLAQFERKDDARYFGIWHDPEYKESDVDGEAAIEVNDNVPGSDRVKVYALPEVEHMACLVYQGSYNKMMQPYKELVAWVETNGYQVIGPNREIYIEGGMDLDDHSYVTEIQFPVAKVPSMVAPA
jgi:effector-binding domain-containing protein